jgi:hypothetical protein
MEQDRIWLFFVVFSWFSLFAIGKGTLCEMEMWGIRCKLAFLATLLMFSAAGASFCVFAVDESDAGSAIVVAEGRIVVCYRAVADADAAGANTTVLLAVLDEAGWLLSRANLAYEMGDFGSALDFANQSQERLNDFVAQADASRETAIQQRYWNFMVHVVGSIVGAIGVVCGGFFVWFFLKRRYEKAGRVV